MIRHIFPVDSFSKKDSLHLGYRREPDDGSYTHCLLEVYDASSDVDIGIYLTPPEVEDLCKYLNEYINMMNDREIVYKFSYLDNETEQCEKSNTPTEKGVLNLFNKINDKIIEYVVDPLKQNMVFFIINFIVFILSLFLYSYFIKHYMTDYVNKNEPSIEQLDTNIIQKKFEIQIS